MQDLRKKSVLTHQLHFTQPEHDNMPMFSLLQTDGSLYDPNYSIHLDQATALKIYDTYLLIRALDQRMIATQRQGRISFYMTETGEEATDIGSCAALDSNDVIMAQYREQGALAYRGFTLDQFMQQIFATELDLGKGRQMPIHYGSRELNYLTISSPLATQIPQATGYAYGFKVTQQANCVICYFGEGAASEGDFHAGLNMAAVLKVPVIFFCRNNGYAISTPAHEQYAGDGIAARGAGYGIKTLRVDGNDVLAVYEATRLARTLAIEGSQPILIEAMTYRLGAHSSSDDPSAYRSQDEEEPWRKQDKEPRFKHWLIKQGWWTDEQDLARKEEYSGLVIAAMKRAEQLDKPSLDSLFSDVYQQLPEHLKQQQQQLEAHIKRYPEHFPLTAGGLK